MTSLIARLVPWLVMFVAACRGVGDAGAPRGVDAADAGLGPASGGSGGGEPSGNGASGGGEAAGPAAMSALTPQSNTPGAVFVGAAEQGGRTRLLSSNLAQSASAQGFVQEWYAEVENTGSVTACQIRVEVGFAVSGVEVARHSGMVDGDPYDVGVFPLVAPCVAPGRRSALYSTALAEAEVDLTAITSVTLTWDGFEAPEALAHPATWVGVMSVDDRAITGSLRNDADYTMTNLGASFYLKDDGGLIFARQTVTHPEALAPGSVWSFSTTPSLQAFRFSVRSLDLEVSE